MLLTILLLIVTSFAFGEGFYLPGVAPVTYGTTCNSSKIKCKSEIPVFANRLRSTKNLLPYEYSRFGFCDNAGSASSLNLGQVVQGDRIEQTPYKFDFAKPEKCKIACKKVYSPDNHGNQASFNENLEILRSRIYLDYHNNFIVDNVPVTWCFDIAGSETQICNRDFPIGCYMNSNITSTYNCLNDGKVKSGHYLFNHLDFMVKYHKGEEEDPTSIIGRIISVHVSPKSYHYSLENPVIPDACDRNLPKLQIPEKLSQNMTFYYTYSVKWKEEKNILWGNRWDYILNTSYTKILWFSLVNTLICLGFLAGILGKILWQTLHNDNSEKEMCWKLLHGDVFRPPKNIILLCAIIGNGMQIFVMATVILALACFGVLSPPNRGALMTSIIIFYFCLSPVAGFTAARWYKMFGGEKKKSLIIVTAMLFQGIMFGLIMLTNNIHWIKGTSAALPFWTVAALLALWLFLSVPLTCLGGFVGFRKKIIEQPVKTSNDLRRIPPKSCCKNIDYFCRIILSNLIPFSVVFIQLFFILNSIWAHQVYYVFGFLYMQYILLIISVCMVSPILCYFQLCLQDYKWWWKTLIVSAVVTIATYGYMVYYLFMKLEIYGFTSIFLYLVYSVMMVIPLFLLSAALAFISSFFFVKKIYSIVKQ